MIHTGGDVTMQREATLHDVAERVGVSPRTVSRVVNDEGGFSEATRHRVLQAIEELNYRPNMLARGLITRRSGTIGLVGNMSDPFFPMVAEGVQMAASATGHTMFFASSGNNPDRQARVIETLWSHAVEGVVVFPAGDSVDQLAAYGERGLPVVVVDDLAAGPNVACVSFDFSSAASLAVDHLKSSGRRKIGMVASVRSPKRRRRRESGFLDAMTGSGESSPPIVRVPPTVVGGTAGTAELLRKNPDIDAIVAYNDLIALGVTRFAAESGRIVPDDLAVIGCDDLAMSSLVTPAITTVRLDRDRLSNELIRALAELTASPGLDRPPVILPVELMRRDSA